MVFIFQVVRLVEFVISDPTAVCVQHSTLHREFRNQGSWRPVYLALRKLLRELPRVLELEIYFILLGP